MSPRFKASNLVSMSLLFLICGGVMEAQSFLAELRAEHNPAKRSEMALAFADEAFDNARELYGKGQIQAGDAQLENMTNVLRECVASLQEAHKSRYYKKAELKVASLQRRLQGLLDDLSVEQRGWAEYTGRKLDEIHDKLLNGVMGK